MAENPEPKEIKAPEPIKSTALNYKEPVWSGKPPEGATLEILKQGSIIKTVHLKDKNYFLFGREQGAVDVLCEHESISRKHLILQFKDTGDAYVYDLGSTHGTLINKRAIPAYEYIKLNNSDLFKLGKSTRLYIYSYDVPQSDEEIEESVQTTVPQKSRKERMLKLYEEKKKQDEQFQSDVENKGTTWGMRLEQDDSTRVNQIKNSKLISEEEIAKYGLKFGQQI